MNNKSLIFFIILFSTLSNVSILEASSNGIDVNLQVGSCNNNGVCDVGQEDMFSCPADCTPPTVNTNTNSGSGSGSGVAVPVMDSVFNNLTVDVKNNSATITWKSSIPTISNFKWGTNPDYKDGVIKNIDFLMDHKVELTNLKDGTTYYFDIEVENLLGKTKSLTNQVFQTRALIDTTPPSNSTNVSASSSQAGITIYWTNPNDSDFDYIRVMKNTDRYYASPYVGYLVYEGKGSYFTDSNVSDGNRYFYSIFSRDRAGNYSSGSIIDLVHNPKGKDNLNDVLPPIITTRPLKENFQTVQGSSTYDFHPSNIFNLNGDSPIIIKTNYLSGVKDDDIWIELSDSEGMPYGKYFFSRLRDNDGYISVIIPPFGKPGYYNMVIYGYEGGGMQIVNYGSLQISKASTPKPINSLLFVPVLALPILLILFALFRIFRRFIFLN